MAKVHIRPITICIVRRDNDILVFEGQDSVKGDRYCRPLGGGIEFGEHSRDAVRREFREEIGAELTDLHLLGVLENIFECDGKPGHEIVHVYEGRLIDEALYQQAILQGREDNGVPLHVTWRGLGDIENGDVRLVPEGLAELLETAGAADTKARVGVR